MHRTDVNSYDILKNSCPVCGYLTLDERNVFEICGICFWEDDGVDDFEENKESGPNYMTLKEGRAIFQEAKQKLMLAKVEKDPDVTHLKVNFSILDNIIAKDQVDTSDIIKLQDEIIDWLSKNRVYGLEKLFYK